MLLNFLGFALNFYDPEELVQTRNSWNLTFYFVKLAFEFIHKLFLEVYCAERLFRILNFIIDGNLISLLNDWNFLGKAKHFVFQENINCVLYLIVSTLTVHELKTGRDTIRKSYFYWKLILSFWDQLSVYIL